jgi:cobalamin biosynthesis protein CobT
MDVDISSQPDMSAVLEKLSTRKEMRKVGKGVIRFKGGEVDQREVILDDDYTEGLAPSDDEEDDDDEEEDDEEHEEDDEDDEELEVDDLDSDEEVIEGADFEVASADEDEDEATEEEESEPEPEPVSRKLKRKADPVASPGEKKKPRTHKRVSFGGKLGATGSKDLTEAQAKEVKSILKRKRDSEGKAVDAVTVTTKAPVVAKVKATAPAAAPAVNGNGKAKKVKGTYDFSAHF